MASLRIAFVTSQFPQGPGEVFLRPEVRAIAALGHDVLVVPVRPQSGWDFRNSHRSGGFSTRTEGLMSWRVVTGSLAEGSHGLGMPRVLSPRRPRTTARNLASLPKALWLTRTLRDWGADHVHAYWGSVPATAAWLVSVRASIPWSFTLHRWDIYEDNFLAAKLRHAAFARVISHRGLSTVRRIAPHAPGPRVLHLGIDIQDLVRRESQSSGDFRILVPASLIAVKGHSVLVDAVSRTNSPVKVDLAGDGPLRANLKALVSRRGLEDRIRFLGFVPHEDILAGLRERYDAVVIPSIERGEEHEGIPVSLMEAMAAGLPVVSTSTGSIPELVTPDNGVLVPPNDPTSLARALDLLACDPELRLHLGNGGRARVCADFSAGKSAAVLSDWFERAATKPSDWY